MAGDSDPHELLTAYASATKNQMSRTPILAIVRYIRGRRQGGGGAAMLVSHDSALACFSGTDLMRGGLSGCFFALKMTDGGGTDGASGMIHA